MVHVGGMVEGASVARSGLACRQVVVIGGGQVQAAGRVGRSQGWCSGIKPGAGGGVVPHADVAAVQRQAKTHGVARDE